ncbi:MAG TPA: ribosome biogenesis GTP-binding protein YihA/YsxC [Nitrospinota bacterium]|jgi:GTP-binding protein|nr:ribosome biogenesis GTP-binding protein YihA/YsxC [Nitrospinota bacterium]
MKIISAEFIKSAVDPAHFPKEDVPEVAFAGRSNVGKSSLMNSLLNRKNLVKVSSTPGKTQLINFFKINNQFFFVDLPGYGFARVPDAIKKKWGRMIETYLKKRKNLCLVVLILDIRHKPTEDDRLMAEWLDFYQIRTVFVANKSDKVKKSEKNKKIRSIFESLEKQEKEVIIFSSKKGEGKNDLWKAIKNSI